MPSHLHSLYNPLPSNEAAGGGGGVYPPLDYIVGEEKFLKHLVLARSFLDNFIVLYVLQANIFDTAGGERFRTLTSNYFQHTDAALLMYAVDDQRSLERLYDEAENALRFIEPESFVWAVVGNKADLRPEIEEASAKALSSHLGAKLYFYTSAKTGLNVKECMNTIVRSLHKVHTGRGRIQLQSYKSPNTIKLPVSNERESGKSPNVSTLTGGSKTTCCK